MSGYFGNSSFSLEWEYWVIWPQMVGWLTFKGSECPPLHIYLYQKIQIHRFYFWFYGTQFDISKSNGDHGAMDIQFM